LTPCSIPEEEELSNHKEVSMRQYETGFLVAPNLSEEETESLIGQMADIVSQKKGRMIKQEKWGKRKLAYPIDRFHEASYVFFTYESGAEVPLELGRRFRNMETVLRHLTLQKDLRDNVRNKKKARRAASKAEAPAPEVPEDKTVKDETPPTGENNG
jgi:small subunit ribosomal protein S6